MNESLINEIEKIIHLDPGERGISATARNNLYSVTRGHLYNAAKNMIQQNNGTIGIVTGFFIPHSKPPAPETDGPPGALALARGLCQLGNRVLLITDKPCVAPLRAGADIFFKQPSDLEIIEFPLTKNQSNQIQANPQIDTIIKDFLNQHPSLTSLISIERVGPSFTWDSFINQRKNRSSKILEEFKLHGPGELSDLCLNMKAEVITQYSADIYLLFEYIQRHLLPITTIGIGDGGNEIGMGSIPWEIIHHNIRNGNGGKIACRIATDYTIVAGVSNWAGYALMAAICILLKKHSLFLDTFTVDSETMFMHHLYKKRIAVDGVFGYPSISVDGIDWKVHINILQMIQYIVYQSYKNSAIL